MSQISEIRNPWRDQLLTAQASFRNVKFHVETGSRASGRRVVTHEYPKRDDPYAEDMGRHARRFSISGYLIYRVNPPPGFDQYTIQRSRLMKALDDPDAGKLIHPVFAQGGMMVMCERYNMVESREKGGYTQFEMSFVEAGTAGNSMAVADTVGQVATRANDVTKVAAGTLDMTGDQSTFSI